MRDNQAKYVRLSASRVSSETDNDGISGEDDVGAASGPEGRTSGLAHRKLGPHRHLGGRSTDGGVHGHHLGVNNDIRRRRRGRSAGLGGHWGGLSSLGCIS